MCEHVSGLRIKYRLLIFRQQSLNGLNGGSAVNAERGPLYIPTPARSFTESTRREDEGEQTVGRRGWFWTWASEEEDRVEEKAINTRGGEQVLQANVIYRVYVPYSGDR